MTFSAPVANGIHTMLTSMWTTVAKPTLRYVRDYVNPLNVYESLRPLVNICNYIGILPVCMIGRRPNRRFGIARLFYINTVLHLLLFVVALLRSMRNGSLFSHFFDFDAFTSISEIFQLITAFASMGVVYAVCFAHRYRFVAAVDQLQLVDRRLEHKLGIVQDYWRDFVWIMWNIVAYVVVFAIYVAGCVMLIKMSDHEVSMSTFVSYFMPHTVVAQIVFQHRCWVWLIVRRATDLNGVVLWNMCIIQIL